MTVYMLARFRNIVYNYIIISAIAEVCVRERGRERVYLPVSVKFPIMLIIYAVLLSPSSYI